MPNVPANSAKDALKWMKKQAGGKGARVLFRGQSRVWCTIKPSITRDDPETRSQMWAICRWFYSSATGVTGYSIDKGHDRLAILQHYILRSPVIDLTGTPEVALYFALQGAKLGQECVVYSVDVERAEVQGVVFSDHFFLVLPLQEGGLKHRWLKQDGHSVGPENWRDPEVVQNFDMLKLNGIDCMRFVRQRNDGKLVKDLGDLESVENDLLATRVRGAVSSIAKGLDVLSPSVEQILLAAKANDPDAELAAEIDSLMVMAKSLGRADLTAQLKEIEAALERGYWDTSWDAAFSSIEERVYGAWRIAGRAPANQR